MAQEPSSAKYDGMPSSAIGTGLVDLVLPPDQMPAKLIYYFNAPHAPIAQDAQPAELNGSGGEPVQKVLVLLRDRVGHDFTCYKQSTITRRIQRRMSIQQIDGIEKYLRYVPVQSQRAGRLVQGSIDWSDQLLPGPPGFRGHQGKGHPQTFGTTEAQAGPAGVGAGLLHRRGGVFPGHHHKGVPGQGGERRPSAGVRHGHRQGGGGQGPGGAVPRQHRRRLSAPSGWHAISAKSPAITGSPRNCAIRWCSRCRTS